MFTSGNYVPLLEVHPLYKHLWGVFHTWDLHFSLAKPNPILNLYISFISFEVITATLK